MRNALQAYTLKLSSLESELIRSKKVFIEFENYMEEMRSDKNYVVSDRIREILTAKELKNMKMT